MEFQKIISFINMQKAQNQREVKALCLFSVQSYSENLDRLMIRAPFQKHLSTIWDLHTSSNSKATNSQSNISKTASSSPHHKSILSSKLLLCQSNPCSSLGTFMYENHLCCRDEICVHYLVFLKLLYLWILQISFF